MLVELEVLYATFREGKQYEAPLEIANTITENIDRILSAPETNPQWSRIIDLDSMVCDRIIPLTISDASNKNTVKGDLVADPTYIMLQNLQVVYILHTRRHMTRYVEPFPGFHFYLPRRYRFLYMPTTH